MADQEMNNKALLTAYGSFLFVLPLYEAPKNVLFVVLMVGTFACLLNKKCLQSFDLRINGLDIILFLMLFATILSSLVNWPLNEGIKGFRDVFFFSLIGVVTNHIKFNDWQLKLIAFVLLISCLIGILISLYKISIGDGHFVTLHSVGSYPSSSMYFASCIFISAGLFFSEISNKSIQIASAAIGALILIALVLSGSRGGALGFVAALMSFLLITFRMRNLKMKTVFVSVFSFSVIVSVVVFSGKMNPLFIKNTQEAIEQLESGKFNKNDGVRFENWRLAYTVFQNADNKAFGIGPQEFAWIDRENIGYKPYFWKDFNSDWKLTHAHNQFFDKLVEEGILGLVALLLFYIYGGYQVIRMRHDRIVVGWTWYAALGSLVVVFVAGSFNQPFSNEVATLLVVIVSLFSSRIRNIERRGVLAIKN